LKGLNEHVKNVQVVCQVNIKAIQIIGGKVFNSNHGTPKKLSMHTKKTKTHSNALLLSKQL
jgi:hypothetical protein